MTAPPGVSPASPINTVRLTEKKASEGNDPALVRKSVAAVAALTGTTIKTARQQVHAFLAGGQSLTDLDAYLRATFREDPDGVTATRNVFRERRY